MSQITRKWIANGAIDETKIDSVALGDGLTGGSGTKLSVRIGSGLTWNAGVIEVVPTDLSGLQGQIDALDTRLDTAESDIDTLQAGLAQEITDRTNADSALDTRLDTAESDIDTLQAGLAQEITNRTNADTALDTRLTTAEADIDALEARMTTAEGAIDTVEAGLAQEIIDRTNADTAINTTIATFKTDAAAAIVAAVEGAMFQTLYKVTAADITAGYINISGFASLPAVAGNVAIVPVTGVEQVNKQLVGTTGVTADFDVSLTSGSERIIIGTAIDATLSGIFEANDVLKISYVKDTTVTIA